jgi:endoglycosylceramidase
MARPWLTLPLLSSLVCASSSALAVGEVRVEGGRFVDASGAVVVLRGVNVAGDAKVPPFRPCEDPAIFDPLPGFGFDSVRLLFTWEAFEPEPGVYDEGYLAYYVSAVRAATSRGLYVIVDFHQDAFSRFSLDGCGEGFPRWALDPAITPDEPDNGPACESWGVKMTQDEEMHGAFTSLWADVGGARTAYLAMLGAVAEALADEPGVLGYDLMNEPWGDEVTELAPFHQEAAAVVRAVSPEALIFVSPRALTSSGEDTLLPPPAFEGAAYAPHFYDASVLLFGAWSGLEPEVPFARMTGKAAEWEVPLFVGELGAPAESEGALDYVDMLYRRLDEGFHSSAHWAYTPGWTPEGKDGWNQEDLSIVDDAGNLRPNFRPRPQPRRVAGEPGSFEVTHEPARLVLTWQHDPDKGETTASVPATWLGGDAKLTSSHASCALEGELLRCGAEAAGPASVELTAEPARASAELPMGCALAPHAGGEQASARAWPRGWLALAGLGLVALCRRRRRAPA